ncbi:MAG: SLC13 family permease [Faecousia sp.]
MSMYIVIGVMVLFVVMMLSGKFSMLKVGMTCLSILVMTGALTLQEAFSGFTNKNVIMLIGMFALAGQFGKTDLVLDLQKKLLSAKGGSDFKIAFLMFGVSALLAQFIPSQTGIIVIMMSFLTALGSTGEVTVSRMLIPITFLSTIWLGRLPIGSGVSSYLMWDAFIEAAGGPNHLDVFSFPLTTIIPAIILLVYCLFTYKMMPKKDVDLSAYQSRGPKGGEPQRLSKKDNYCIYTAFVLAILALVFVNKIGDRAYAIPLVLDIILIYLKVLNGRDVLMTLINGPALMAGSIMALADAMTNSGAGNLVGAGILKLLGGNPNPFVILLTFGVVSVLLTSFVSNTACMFVLVPVACNVCVTAGYDCRAVVITIVMCSTMSILTPMSSGGAALAYSTVGMTVKDTWKWAVPAAVIGTLATVINCYLVYPL